MKKKGILLIITIAFLLNVIVTPVTQSATAKSNFAFRDKEYADSGYLGSGSLVKEESETTLYTYKTDTEYAIPNGIPTYFDGTAAPNACAVNSGSVVVGYYNRVISLIPGFTAGRTVMGVFRWNLKDATVQSMITQLYTLMKTDPNPGGGTTIPNYKSGLTQYTSSRGYSASITSRMSSATFNYSQTKQSISNSKLVTLFMAGYTIFLDVESSGTTDIIYKAYFSGNHVIVAYGYREISYYDSAWNVIKQHQYLKIFTSVPEMATGYLKLNDGCKVDDAYEINMF